MIIALLTPTQKGRRVGWASRRMGERGGGRWARSVRKEDMIAIAVAAAPQREQNGANRRCGTPLPSFLPSFRPLACPPGLMNSNAFLVAEGGRAFTPSSPRSSQRRKRASERASERTGRRTDADGDSYYPKIAMQIAERAAAGRPAGDGAKRTNERGSERERTND